MKDYSKVFLIVLKPGSRLLLLEYEDTLPSNPSERDKDSRNLLTIDTRLLPETYVLKLDYVVVQLGLEIPERATQHVEGAFLCLHTIPESAIVKSASPSEVKKDTQVIELSYLVLFSS